MFILFIYTFFYCLLVFKAFTKLTAGKCESSKCLVGKTAIVTGARCGIGFETAKNFASRGCRVIIADVEDSSISVENVIKSTGNNNVVYMNLDLASLESVRTFARHILQQESRLDILINNAGSAGANKKKTNDDLPKIMQTNYLGHFLLTNLLTDLIKRTPKSRIVFVSSVMAFFHQIKSAEDINKPPKIKSSLPHAIVDYANSKICILIAANEFGKRLKKYRVTCNTAYPGFVQTSFITTFLSAFKRTKKEKFYKRLFEYILIPLVYIFSKTRVEGSQMTLHCALDADIEYESGGFYFDGINFWQPPITKNELLCDEIWTQSERLVGLTS